MRRGAVRSLMAAAAPHPAWPLSSAAAALEVQRVPAIVAASSWTTTVYRSCLRAADRCPDGEQRAFMRQYLQQEFRDSAFADDREHLAAKLDFATAQTKFTRISWRKFVRLTTELEDMDDARRKQPPPPAASADEDPPWAHPLRRILAGAGGEATVVLLKAVITAFPSVSLPFLAVPLRSHRTVAIRGCAAGCAGRRWCGRGWQQLFRRRAQCLWEGGCNAGGGGRAAASGAGAGCAGGSARGRSVTMNRSLRTAWHCSQSASTVVQERPILYMYMYLVPNLVFLSVYFVADRSYSAASLSSAASISAGSAPPSCRMTSHMSGGSGENWQTRPDLPRLARLDGNRQDVSTMTDQTSQPASSTATIASSQRHSNNNKHRASSCRQPGWRKQRQHTTQHVGRAGARTRAGVRSRARRRAGPGGAAPKDSPTARKGTILKLK
eukprot:SAG22_NODE_275_length_13171_cov_11.640606_15_plen_439_part_00